MAVSAPTLAAGQLADALTQARMSRHHPGCRCGLYRRAMRLDGILVHGAGYCTADESRYSEMVDRLLEAVRKNRF